MNASHSKLNSETDADVLEAISLAIAAVKRETGYGSIEITVHNGRVTQIERREKVRFEHGKQTSKPRATQRLGAEKF